MLKNPSTSNSKTLRPYRAFPFTLLTVLLFSCKQQLEKTTDAKDRNNTLQGVIDTSVATIDNDTLRKIATELSILKHKKARMLRELQSLSKEEGNQLYASYRNGDTLQINNINELLFNVLDNYYSFYNEKQKNFVFPKAIINQVKLINTSDLEIWDVGEGMAEIRYKPDYYYKLFKGRVTPDYEYYLKKEAEEESVLYIDDASLAISFKELSDRILTWERFLKEYPNSALTAVATKRYQDYVMMYIGGLDNSETINWSDRTIYNENLKEFKRFMTKNPNSNTTRILSFFLANFEKLESREMFDALLKKELHIPEQKETAETTP